MPSPAYGSLPFAEQIAFFRGKLNIPTERWDDLLGAAHDRAFVVAGAMQADLLADLRAAVEKGIAQGTTLAEFRRDFDDLVARRGWTGWTGEGSAGGRAWRTEVIYGTNLRTSYAAGRYQQLQEIKDERPFWRYRHNDNVLTPRPEHQAWDGKILPADDPWWRTHYPPNGWGCRCYIEALAPRDLQRLGIDPATLQAPTAPGDLTGIDRGWEYAPGASVDDDLRRLQALAAGKGAKVSTLPGDTTGINTVWDYAPDAIAAPSIVMKVIGNPSTAMVARVRQILDDLPDMAKHALGRANARVVVGRTLTGACPSLKGQTPRGWPKGATWDNADGCASDGTAYVAERARDFWTKGRPWYDASANRTAYVVQHELGHAIDAELGYESFSDGFRSAHQADVKRAKDNGLKIDDYFLQADEAGPSETFAEQFMNVVAGKGDMQMPETYAYLRAILGLGGVK